MSSHFLLFHLFISKQLRVNQAIRARTVRLIDDQENQLGIVAIEEALRLATERETDLVEVSPIANPPVCRLLDYGKYLYRLKKQEQKQKKGAKKTEVKGVRLSFRISENDLAIKARQSKEFIQDRNMVKVSMVLRGREFAHIDLAFAKMKIFSDQLSEFADIDQYPKRQGNTIIAIFVPKKAQSVKSAQTPVPQPPVLQPKPQTLPPTL